MNNILLDRLRCPKTGQSLERIKDESSCDWLVSKDNSLRYPIRNEIPRFVAASNYADNFGMQWNHFLKTQLDSYSGHPITAKRFWKATGWDPAAMQDKWVLDVGCGSGRFSEIALSSGANVVALDYSSAVDACWQNLGHHQNFHVVQGDIYELPFAHNSFDFVYSLGVLQHTPDVRKAFFALPPIVVEGGQLCVDYYWKRFRTMMNAKYLFRPFTKNMPQDRLFAFLQRNVPLMLAISRGLGAIPLLGKALKRLVPVANYSGVYPLSEKQLQEWALLDTFDMLSPKYDKPQTAHDVGQWFKEANFSEIDVLHVAHLVARGRKLSALE